MEKSIWKKFVSSNSGKYTAVVLLAFITGAAQTAGDNSANLMDCLRHGVLAMVPALIALQVTLTKAVGMATTARKEERRKNRQANQDDRREAMAGAAGRAG